MNENEAIYLDGFTNNSVSTLGTCTGKIRIKNEIIEQKFHIVPNTVKMSNYDVILGREFWNGNDLRKFWGQKDRKSS